MIEIITSWLGLTIMLIGAMATFIGPKAWPAIRGWYSGVLNALLYPFRGAERKIAELYEKNEKMYENVKLLDKKLDGLIEQFKPNGGSSIKDSLNRIELKQASNENITSFLINSLDVPMYKTDSSGLLVWVSKSYANISGRSSEDLLGWGWLTSVSNEDVQRVRSKWKSAVEEKRSFEDNYKVIKPNGEVTKVHAKASPTFFNNKIAGWVGALEIDNER